MTLATLFSILLTVGYTVRSVLWHLRPLWTSQSTRFPYSKAKRKEAETWQHLIAALCKQLFKSPTRTVKSFNNKSFCYFFPLFPPVFVNVPRALKFNMNNVCIFCYILYKILAVGPSFRAFNHGPPGVLWDTCSLKPSEELERVGTAGKKEKSQCWFITFH